MKTPCPGKAGSFDPKREQLVRGLVEYPARWVTDALVELLHILDGSANIFNQAPPAFDRFRLIDQSEFLKLADPRRCVNLGIVDG